MFIYVHMSICKYVYVCPCTCFLYLVLIVSVYIIYIRIHALFSFRNGVQYVHVRISYLYDLCIYSQVE